MKKNIVLFLYTINSFINFDDLCLTVVLSGKTNRLLYGITNHIEIKFSKFSEKVLAGRRGGSSCTT